MRFGSLFLCVLGLAAAAPAAEPAAFNGLQWTEVNRLFDRLTAEHQFDAGSLLPRGTASGPNRLTRDEQITMLSLCDLASSPLASKANLPDDDEWTHTQLSNQEAMAINHDPGAKPARWIRKSGAGEVWAKSLANGDLAVGFFNRGDTTTTVGVFWPALGLTGPCWVRDIWNGEDRPEADRGLEVDVAPHGAVLVRLHPIAAKPAS